MGQGEAEFLVAQLERVGLPHGHLRIINAEKEHLADEELPLPDHSAALKALLDWLGSHQGGIELEAVGHRVVHGGAAYSEPQLIDDDLVAALRRLVPIDPLHLPQAIDAIEATRRAYPDRPQVACFDTAFHRHMPRVAQIYALPRRFAKEGVVRYGFHGLSYEYIMSELRLLDREAARERVVIAHLGNGASMAAVRDGVSVDTTMGFTPTGGLVMGTRPGDLDPGVLLYLLQPGGPSPNELNTLLNKQSGLLGVSENSADMQDLLNRENQDDRAAEAVALFCYQAKKFLGALIAALGGLDTLVFTAGIGEHAAPVRERICAGLDFLGIQLDPERNAQSAPIISRDGSPVVVRVMHTDEDLMIARHTYRIISRTGASHVPV
jgi:acetate kinase